jgi:hypothetical protein
MEELISRVQDVINNCWESFSAKVGGGLIEVNKEASMQLHFAYLLKNTIDLAKHHEDENIKIELETGIRVNGRLREADLVIEVTKGSIKQHIPIEMKCYKTKTASDGLRGAHDLFRYGIYEDLQLLELYTQNPNYLQGIQLTMTNSKIFGFPNSTKGKSWDYNTASGTIINNGININTPIGGKEVSITLAKNYIFNWTEINGFYFLMLQGD